MNTDTDEYNRVRIRDLENEVKQLRARTAGLSQDTIDALKREDYIIAHKSRVMTEERLAEFTRIAEARDQLADLCRRAIKYAREDRMVTPRFTRLQRVLDLMDRALAASAAPTDVSTGTDVLEQLQRLRDVSKRDQLVVVENAIAELTRLRALVPSIEDIEYAETQRLAADSVNAEYRALLDASPKCAHCGKIATCVGAYEGNTVQEYACDECCGHGNEDGYCQPVGAPPRRPAPTVLAALEQQILRLRANHCPTMKFNFSPESTADAVRAEVDEVVAEPIGSERARDEACGVIAVAVHLAIVHGANVEEYLSAEVLRLQRRLDHVEAGGTWAEAKEIEKQGYPIRAPGGRIVGRLYSTPAAAYDPTLETRDATIDEHWLLPEGLFWQSPSADGHGYYARDKDHRFVWRENGVGDWHGTGGIDAALATSAAPIIRARNRAAQAHATTPRQPLVTREELLRLVLREARGAIKTMRVSTNFGRPARAHLLRRINEVLDATPRAPDVGHRDQTRGPQAMAMHEVDELEERLGISTDAPATPSTSVDDAFRQIINREYGWEQCFTADEESSEFWRRGNAQAAVSIMGGRSFLSVSDVDNDSIEMDVDVPFPIAAHLMGVAAPQPAAITWTDDGKTGVEGCTLELHDVDHGAVAVTIDAPDGCVHRLQHRDPEIAKRMGIAVARALAVTP